MVKIFLNGALPGQYHLNFKEVKRKAKVLYSHLTQQELEFIAKHRAFQAFFTHLMHKFLNHIFLLLCNHPKKLEQLIEELVTNNAHLTRLARTQDSRLINQLCKNIDIEVLYNLVQIPVLQIMNKSFIAPEKSLNLATTLQTCKKYKACEVSLDDFLCIILPKNLAFSVMRYYRDYNV